VLRPRLGPYWRSLEPVRSAAHDIINSGLVAIQSVGDAVRFDGNAQLTVLDLPTLSSAGSLQIVTNDTLSSLDFESLASIDLGVQITGNPSLLQMGSAFAALTSAGGVDVEENDTLTDVSFPALTTVDGLYVFTNALLTDVSLPALVSVSGGITVRYNPVLARLNGFDALSSVGLDISILDNGLEFGGGAFGDPATGDVKGSIGITGNAELIAIPDFASLSSVGVSVIVFENPNLESTGLVAIDTVPASSQWTNNSSLPQCLVDAFAVQLSQPPVDSFSIGNDNVAVCP
jgi:hypothetical protein